MVGGRDVALILQLFSSCDGAIDGRKRLQKLVYILKKKYYMPFSFSFRPYFYGPYSEDLTDLVETMVGMNFVKESVKDLSPGIVQYNYELTEKGKNLLEKLRKDTELRKKMDDLNHGCSSLSMSETKDLVLTSKKLMGMV